MRRFKRLVVWCTVKRFTSVLMVIAIIDVTIVASIVENGVDRTWSDRLWSLMKYHPLTGRGAHANRDSQIVDLVFLDGQWVTRTQSQQLLEQVPDHDSAQRVTLLPRPSEILAGFLVPCVRLKQQTPGVALLNWRSIDNSDENGASPETQTKILHAYALFRYGGAERAQYLPAGGMYSPRLIPAGIIHDAIAIPILLVCIGRIAYRRTIRRFISQQHWQQRARYCPTCRYDRTGLTDRPCPECGWGRS